MAEYNNMSYKVCIRCMTYNQSAYITDAMDGFAMQQTNFPFLAVIVDDASTDGEQKVIKAYVKEHFDHSGETGYKEWETEDAFWSFAWHVENKNCNFVVVLLKQNLFGNPKKGELIREWCDAKYVALCEGDDYWTDPMKLQKQVNYLESHPDHSLCCHRYKIYNQNEGTWDDDYVKRLFEESPNGFSFSNADNLNRAWITKTVTLVYRNGLVDQNVLAKYQYRCDEHLNYHLLRMGLGYCFPFIGAVYRRHSAGVYSVLGKKDRLVRWCRIREEMLKFNLSDEVLKNYVYHGLRKYLYNRQICCEELGVACVVLKSFYLTEGLGKTIVAAKKIIGSCVNGLMRKNDS